jgi:hypothetical protein
MHIAHSQGPITPNKDLSIFTQSNGLVKGCLYFAESGQQFSINIMGHFHWLLDQLEISLLPHIYQWMDNDKALFG